METKKARKKAVKNKANSKEIRDGALNEKQEHMKKEKGRNSCKERELKKGIEGRQTKTENKFNLFIEL
jgi:hypothetical protein